MRKQPKLFKINMISLFGFVLLFLGSWFFSVQTGYVSENIPNPVQTEQQISSQAKTQVKSINDFKIPIPDQLTYKGDFELILHWEETKTNLVFQEQFKIRNSILNQFIFLPVSKTQQTIDEDFSVIFLG